MFEDNSLRFSLYSFLHYIRNSALHFVGVIDWVLADVAIGKLRYGELMPELSNMLMNYASTLASCEDMTF